MNRSHLVMMVAFLFTHTQAVEVARNPVLNIHVVEPNDAEEQQRRAIALRGVRRDVAKLEKDEFAARDLQTNMMSEVLAQVRQLEEMGQTVS